MAFDQAEPDQTLALTQALRLTISGEGAARANPSQEGHPSVSSDGADGTAVMVVHGRDGVARHAMFDFLRAIGLKPLEWSTLLDETGSASPYVGEVLDAAFRLATAVVVLFTPDDEARLRAVLRGPDEPAYETNLTAQARPNVLFEAGMAFGSHPKQTVLVELGTLRPFSDVLRRHVVRLDGTAQPLRDIARRLKAAGCAVDLDGDDWARPDRFPAPKHLAEAPAIESPISSSSLSSRVDDMNQDGRRWLSDRDRKLREAEEGVVTHYSSNGLLYSGALLRALAALRTDALHEYRDAFSEKLRVYREVCRQAPDGTEVPRLMLSDDSRAVLSRWRQPTEVHGMEETATVYDPTAEPDETALRDFEQYASGS